MSLDVEQIYSLLPATIRIRDVEEGEPLKALLTVVAEQVAVLQEDLAQLYDDQFVETAANWVIPYIGDLIGYHALNSVIPQIASPRAEVANTIGYRRRKGTASMLEQLARDVTGWDAHAVEYFQLLATTQYMNHIRLKNLVTPDLRKWEPLERLNSAFETSTHTLDVRRIASGRGKYNIPNVGIFLFRLHAYAVTNAPAFQLDAHRFLFSPLGNNTPLFNEPQTEKTITQLATPSNVPMSLSRRVLDAYLNGYYGDGKSLSLRVDNSDAPAAQIVVCDLSDAGAGAWAHNPPSGKIAIDPVLGRIAFPGGDPAPTDVYVSFHYGFSADMGGGEYNRAETFDDQLKPVEAVSARANIQAALNLLTNGGVVEITDNELYAQTPSINVPADARIEVRALNERRPHLQLGGDLEITGDETSTLTLNGLLISAKSIQVNGNLGRLRLQHCTLVPALELATDGTPKFPDGASLIVNAPNTIVEIDHCILGGIRAGPETQVTITNSIVDATSEERVAFASTDNLGAGGVLTIKNSTVIGKVHTRLLDLASNTIFLARLAPGDTWNAPVLSERKQEGCVRFSYVPPDSRVPRRYHCQPTDETADARVQPQFTSLRYGDPGYCQLSQRCAIEIRRGADDEAEMGAFHDLFQPQRESNLRVRLDEYLRLGLEAGIFFAT